MARMIFIHLPVGDLARSTAFYENIGFRINSAFSNAQASAMEWSETIHVMLLARDFYSTFTAKPIADAHATSGSLLCLTFDSRDEVDAIHRAAKTAGAAEPRPIEDQGFMYGGAFEDPDGHTWETVWMDAGAVDAPPA